MSIQTLYAVRTGDDPEAVKVLRLLADQMYGLQGVAIEKVMRVQTDTDPADPARLKKLFLNSVTGRASTTSMLDSEDGVIVEVCYKRAWTDPEMASALHGCEALGVKGVSWVRLATRYQLKGIRHRGNAEAIVQRLLINSQTQTILSDDEPWNTLIPQGAAAKVEWLPLSSMTLEQLRELSHNRRVHMSDQHLLALKSICRNKLSRDLRDAEFEMFAGAWSDHCNHTAWKSLGLIQKIQQATTTINHPLVISAFVDNSGVMRFYDGWALNMKGETHISPTFAGDPYGGIMTKHGGVIRDIIFTGQGAWPWAGTTVMATCDPHMPWDQVPEGSFHPRIVMNESIRGTHDYDNPMGIPMAWSEYLIDPRNVKGLALGHSFGILPEARAKKGTPRPGDLVVLIGGPTGADGIHGATTSSAAATAETVILDATHVQIGAPIEEIKFKEAAPKLRDADCVVACTDCGAAGLSSACGEIGSETGIWINLAWVPLKCAALPAWQIWISESQERGVLAVPADKLELALSILSDYDVPASVIGVFTNSQSCQVVHDAAVDQQVWIATGSPVTLGQLAVDIPYELLENCPLPEIEVRPRERKLIEFEPQMPLDRNDWIHMVRSHLGHFNIADQSRIAHRYEQTVQGNTVVPYVSGQFENMTDELFVATPIRGKPYGAGVAVSTNQFYGDIDPYGLGRLVYTEAVTRLVAAGFHPTDISCCVNVYTPKVTDSPENAYDLVRLVEGYTDASVELGIPVITGKDSSSGTFTTKEGVRIDAPLTLSVAALGRMSDAHKVVRKPFVAAGDRIVLFHPGLHHLSLTGSVFLDGSGQRGDRLIELDLGNVLAGLSKGYHHWVWDLNMIRSRSAIRAGGLVRSLFESMVGSGLGCSIQLRESKISPLIWLFAELSGSIMFTTTARWPNWPGAINCHDLGVVTETPTMSVSLGEQLLFEADIESLGQEWKRTVTEVL